VSNEQEAAVANIPLKGSERIPMTGAKVIAPADPHERLEVTVLVRRSESDELQSRLKQIAVGKSAGVCMSRDEFAKRHGADAADLAAVRDFAAANGLAVVLEDAARRTVILSGTVAQFNAAFSVDLKLMRHDSCSYRGRTGSVHLPAALNGIVEAVLGLDSRPQAAPHFRIRPAASAATSFTPTQVASLYAFPQSSGAGQCVAIIELGGGFRPADLDTYFKGLSVSSPAVVAVSVDHAQNAPTGDANGPDGEVMLDIEVVGAIVPQAKIAVYFAPNTDAGFLDAITTAIHDTTNKPSVISISWGGPESSWTPQAMTAMDEAFQAAATLGITVCVASGDNGSSDGVTDGADHVDFPASSSFALACGGTSLSATSSAISGEVVWNNGANGGASGGGVSTFFAAPAWQSALSVTSTQGGRSPLAKRGVPDVAGNADPETGYQVRVDGSNAVFGGTSAVAPLWAALIARLNQLSGKSAGLISPQIYQTPKSFRDITTGNNGDFAAASGWDACSGLGSPNGAALRSII
jgi:kumamolisin